MTNQKTLIKKVKIKNKKTDLMFRISGGLNTKMDNLLLLQQTIYKPNALDKMKCK